MRELSVNIYSYTSTVRYCTTYVCVVYIRTIHVLQCIVAQPLSVLCIIRYIIRNTYNTCIMYCPTLRATVEQTVPQASTERHPSVRARATVEQTVPRAAANCRVWCNPGDPNTRFLVRSGPAATQDYTRLWSGSITGYAASICGQQQRSVPLTLHARWAGYRQPRAPGFFRRNHLETTDDTFKFVVCAWNTRIQARSTRGERVGRGYDLRPRSSHPSQ